MNVLDQVDTTMKTSTALAMHFHCSIYIEQNYKTQERNHGIFHWMWPDF